MLVCEILNRITGQQTQWTATLYRTAEPDNFGTTKIVDKSETYVQRRQLLAATGAVLTVPMLAGCSGADDDEGDEPEEADPEEDESEDGENGEEDTEDDQAGNVIVEGGESHSFEGSGAEVTDEFSLDPGILTVDFAHDGEQNFIVDMLALEGEQWDDELLVNVIGDAEGSSVMSVNGGQYQIDVDADGGWSIDLDQPEATADDLQELPVEESGSGSTWLGPFTAEGVNEIHGSHNGERNFIVSGHDADGGWELMINEIGEYEGTGTFRADGGAFWVDIEADGDWTLEIE